jgi:hypothetical protein
MGSLKFKDWPFNPTEKVSIHWFRSPYRNKNGEWVFDVVFRQKNGSIQQHITIHWGALPWLRLGQYVINGKPLEQTRKGEIKLLQFDNFYNGEIKSARYAIPKAAYKLFVPENYNELCWTYPWNGKQVVVPCIEITRAFLAPNRFLANAIINPAGIYNLVRNVKRTNDHLYLNLTKEIPKSYIDNRIINHMIWLLTNSKAQETWHGVYQSFYSRAALRKPTNPVLAMHSDNLLNVNIPLTSPSAWKAYVIESDDTILVLNILEASGLEHSYKSVLVEHEGTGIIKGFKNAKNIETKYQTNSQNKTLDDSLESSFPSNEKDYEDVEATKLIFSNRPFIQWRSDKKYNREFIKKYANEQKNAARDEVVSTAETSARGKKRQIEFKPPQIEFMNTDVGGLEDFLKTIEYLNQVLHVPVADIRIGELPGDKGVTFVAEGIRRKYAVVKVYANSGAEFLILEIGRPDGYSCSTLFIRTKGFDNFDDETIDIAVVDALVLFIQNNGAWNKDLMKDSQQYTYNFLKHMKQDTENSWSHKMKNKMM